LWYRVTLPGALTPELPTFRLDATEKATVMAAVLAVKPTDDTLLKPAPAENLIYTIENPLRLKDFLEIQVASAKALKTTNDKMNQLLDEKTITELQATVTNIRSLSVQSSQLMTTANHLFQSISQDLGSLVKATQSLTTQLSSLSSNLNQLVSDPQLQTDFKETLHSLNLASTQINELLADPQLKQLLGTVNETAQEVKALSKESRALLSDPVLRSRVENSVALLEKSLTRVDGLLEELQSTSSSEKGQRFEAIVKDTQTTVSNLKRFSKRLTGRFVLWRLLF
jgi:uncharacterized phage infection (PIP) family protein YhgE